jgi:hypothetical protein
MFGGKGDPRVVVLRLTNIPNTNAEYEAMQCTTSSASNSLRTRVIFRPGELHRGGAFCIHHSAFCIGSVPHSGHRAGVARRS